MISFSVTFYDAPRMIRRALVLWLLVRVAIMAVARNPDPGMSFGSVMIMFALVPALCHVDARVMREDIFYANLGRPVWAPAAAGLVVTCALESILAIITRA